MAKTFFTLLVILNAFVSFAQPEKKLAEAFIQSIAKNNFKLLEPYIYNSIIAKNIFGAEFSKLPPSKQAEIVTKYKTVLKDKWTRVVENAKNNKIDISKIQVEQTLTGAIEGNHFLNTILITYEYNGVEWDDLFFLINKKGASKYIVDLPDNTSMFALNEGRRGKNLKDHQVEKDKSDPNVKQHLKDAVELLKKFVAENNTLQLYNHIVYSGEEDKEYRWKRTVDVSKPEDVESAKKIMTKIKAGLSRCDKVNYGDVRMDKESEGVWYVINTICRDQQHTYAFLKINNAFVLGDVD